MPGVSIIFYYSPWRTASRRNTGPIQTRSIRSTANRTLQLTAPHQPSRVWVSEWSHAHSQCG
jgi:hypothetical protein